MHKLIPLTLAAALVAGCAVGPIYPAPRTPAPAAFHPTDTNAFSSAAPEANGSTHVRDPVLDRLIADHVRSRSASARREDAWTQETNTLANDAEAERQIRACFDHCECE